MYKSTKTYCHNVGLSCCFRQWKADSHCRFLHGYAIQIKFTFAARDLDARNWVVDFGSLKTLKGWMEDLLDHKTLVAKDDPELDTFQRLHAEKIIDIRVVDATGCEALAELIYGATETWLDSNGYAPRVHLESVEISEHDGNSAIYMPGV